MGSGTVYECSRPKCPSIAILLAAAVMACGNQDFDRPSRTQDTSIHQGVLLAEIQHATPCTLYRKNRTDFYESKPPNGCRIYRSDPQTVFPSQPMSALDGPSEDRLPTIPTGLPTALISSIATAGFCSRMLAKHRREMGLKHRDISLSQRIRISLQSLLLGLLLGGPLAVLEVSLRHFLE